MRGYQQGVGKESHLPKIKLGLPDQMRITQFSDNGL